MALFGGKKKKEEAAADVPVKMAPKKSSEKASVLVESSTASKAEKSAEQKVKSQDYSSVLIGPRVTEKASMVSEKGNAYVFNVETGATKISIAKAVFDIYNVTPARIRIARIPEKHVFSRGKSGVKSGGKKAYVYLKKGEKIEII